MYFLLPISILLIIQCCVGELVQSFSDLHRKEFDFIIIGGGTAGNVVANRLTENPSVHVLVLEAGGSPEGVLNLSVPYFATVATPGTPNDWNFTTIPQPGLNNRTLAIPRGHVLGGSSSVNYMAYTRGSMDDWNRYARLIRDPGWSWDNMQKYFRRNEKWVAPADHHDTRGQFNPAVHSFTGINSVSLAGFQTSLDQKVIDAAHQSKNPQFFFNLDYNSGRHLGVGHTQSTIGNGQRSSSAASYLGPRFINRRNLHVVLHAQVSRVIKNRNDKKKLDFRTVEFTDGVGGKFERVTAKRELILAGGSIGSPHILLNSGIGDREELRSVGVEPVHHLPSVGKNLSDHPIVSSQWLVNATDEETLDIINQNATLGQEVLELWRNKRSGPFVDGIFNTVAWIRLPSDAEILNKFPGQDPSPGPNTAHIELLPMNGILKPPFPSSGHYLTIGAAMIQPTSRGYVTIASNNAFDPPLIHPNFLGTEFDLALLKEGVKLARTLTQLHTFSGYIISSLNNATTDDEIDQFVKNGVAGFSHPVGTCSMTHEGASYGVVDPDYKLKGADGLRVIDASVLPLTPAAHTQAATYALAERASDMIKLHWRI